MKKQTTEYRVTFYIDGQVWDVVACQDIRRAWRLVGILCERYAGVGALSIVGETIVSTEV